MLKHLAVMSALLVGSACADTDAALMDFMAGQGCAVGPSTVAAALDAGFSQSAIDALSDTADLVPGQTTTAWRMLPADVCTIRPPDIVSKIKLTDPEVTAALVRADDDASDTAARCFISSPLMFDALQQTHGWDSRTADREYMRFLAAHLISGELTFYSDNSLVTPVGFQLVTGACAKVPEIEAIRQSHTALTDKLDTILRSSAPDIECGDARQFVSNIQHPSNAWFGLNVQFIAAGAGWYDGETYNDTGAFRPPLCTYE